MTLSQRITALVQAIGTDINRLTRWPMVCDAIDYDETVTIPEHYQLIIAARLTNSGTLINNGRLHIL
jgi:hypothetical protein